MKQRERNGGGRERRKERVREVEREGDGKKGERVSRELKPRILIRTC